MSENVLGLTGDEDTLGRLVGVARSLETRPATVDEVVEQLKLTSGLVGRG